MERHEKPYRCTFPPCKKTFGSKHDWTRHERIRHIRQNELNEHFWCGFCKLLIKLDGNLEAWEERFDHIGGHKQHIQGWVLEEGVTLKREENPPKRQKVTCKNCPKKVWQEDLEVRPSFQMIIEGS